MPSLKEGFFFMKKIKTIISSFRANLKQDNQEYSLALNYYSYDFVLYYNLSKEEDPKLINLFLDDINLPEVLIAYLSLLQGTALEAIKRISAKELDYYLRDDSSKSFFEFYGPEVYKILEIGSKIYNHHLNFSIEDKIFDPKNAGNFLELSYSEQIEVFEEFLSKYIYPNTLYSLQDFEIEINARSITILYRGEKIDKRLESIFREKLPLEFYLSSNIEILIKQIN